MGSRVALLGANGAGKTTFLSALSRLFDDNAVGCISDCMTNSSCGSSGSRKAILAGAHQIAPNVRAGFVSQQHIDDLVNHLMNSPLEYLRQYIFEKNNKSSAGLAGVGVGVISASSSFGEKGGSWSDLDLRSHLGKFGLGGNICLQPIGAMSGGEKARLAMAAACISCPQILLLDEPTNHLSPSSLIALKTACVEFQGSIVFSSHNKDFVEQVSTVKITLNGGVMTETSVTETAKSKE
jgi:ATPase subunit of ABC transporter with duplicated ATPase domains